jgi:exonuclease SbcD
VKLAHIADPHLGIRQYHRQTAGGINQREADIGAAFRRAVDGVIATRPDAVVVAGDLFHAVRPTNTAIRFAFAQFQRLRAGLPDVPIVLIAGNHDTPRSTETGSILGLFDVLGVQVADFEARRIVFPDRDLSILAVPHQALVGERPELRPAGPERYQVMVLHGEVEGVFPSDRSSVEYGGAPVTPGEITGGGWGYVALGHYHVRHEVAPRVWYAGALEYASSNIWGELVDEQRHGDPGKGWLLVDLESGVAVPQLVEPVRRVLDLRPISAEGKTAAEIDATIAERVASVPGGIADQIVRLRVLEIPRHIARELDHAAVRAYKAEALHFALDLRRPEIHRLVGVGAPGRRQTLPELVRGYLERRPLPAGVDRQRFVHEGATLVESVDRELPAG